MSNSQQQQQQQQPTSSLPSGIRLPSRQELEAKRKAVESSKPVLHFKSTGLRNGIDNANNHGLNSTVSRATKTTTLSSLSSGSSIGPTASSANIDSNIVSSNATSSSSTLPSQSTTATTISTGSTTQASKKPRIQPKDDDFEDLDFTTEDFDLDDEEFLSSGSGTSSAVTTPAASSLSSTTTAPTTVNQTETIAAATAVVAPEPARRSGGSTIIVKTSQRGNPLLQHIRNVPYEFADVVPDYVVGLTSCVLFLSIRYHRLHPDYIYNRIAAVGKTFVLRVILMLVDVDTHQQTIREMTKIATSSQFTLFCAWSNEEAARYIETFKAYENKAPDAIKEKVDQDYLSKLTDCLTQVRSVNKTDVVTLSSVFGSFKNIVEASADEIGLLPGFGEQKTRRLQDAFRQPFMIDPRKRKHHHAG